MFLNFIKESLKTKIQKKCLFNLSLKFYHVSNVKAFD